MEIGVDHTQIVGWRTEFTLENVNDVCLRDIPHHIDRVKTNGDPESFVCCRGAWCVQSTFDPPSLIIVALDIHRALEWLVGDTLQGDEALQRHCTERQAEMRRTYDITHHSLLHDIVVHSTSFA